MAKNPGKYNPDVDNENDMLDDGFPLIYNINESFWETIEKSVPKNSNKFIRYVQNYHDRNIDKLETPVPVDYPIWRPECARIVYETLGIDADDLYEITSNIELPNDYKDKYLQKGNSRSVMLDQFALFMLYRYYLLHNKTKELEVCKYYISYFFYFSLFTKYFKYKPNVEIMTHTINSMTFKNQIKQLGSVSKWIYQMTDNSCKKYEPILLRGADRDYYKVIRRTHTKFNDAMNNLYGLYDKDYKNKNAIYASKSQTEEGEMLDQGSMSGDVIQMADKYTSKFFDTPIYEDVIKYICDMNKRAGALPEKDLRNTLYVISDDSKNQDDVRTFYQCILFLFLTIPNKHYSIDDVGTMKFILEMQQIYRAGNSINKNRIIISDIIDKWLALGSKTFRSTNREATKSNFRKSIFDYFILRLLKNK